MVKKVFKSSEVAPKLIMKKNDLHKNFPSMKKSTKIQIQDVSEPENVASVYAKIYINNNSNVVLT